MYNIFYSCTYFLFIIIFKHINKSAFLYKSVVLIVYIERKVIIFFRIPAYPALYYPLCYATIGRIVLSLLYFMIYTPINRNFVVSICRIPAYPPLLLYGITFCHIRPDSPESTPFYDLHLY